MSGPIETGPVLGAPVVVGSGGPGLGAPIVVGGGVVAGPVVVGGGWQQTAQPIEQPGGGGGTLPVIEGHGPPPELIRDAKVGQYYLDVDSGYLYRLGA